MDIPHDSNAGAPDWSTLDFEVTCPRCAYNLAMLAQPRCPECGLQFGWTDVVEASRHSRRDSPLFEYRWRTRPVRSSLHTLILCMLPSLLWRRVRLTDTPRHTALLAWVALTFLLITALEWLRSAGEMTFAILYFGGAPLTWSTLFEMVPVVDVSGPLRAQGVLFPLTVASVAVYRVTFVRYRIIWLHLFRVGVYTWTAFWAWSVLATTALTAALCTGIYLYGFSVSSNPAWETLALALSLLPPIVALWSLVAAFGRYLQVPRAWLGAICSFVLVTVGLIVFCMTLAVQIEGTVSGEWMEPLGAWIPGLDEWIVSLLF